MKRFFLLILFFLSAVCFAQQTDSDILIFNEVRQSFENGFYPGTVSSADRLQNNYPDSSFIPSALAYKGEALVYMELYSDAIEVLESAIAQMHSGSPEIIRCNYLLGRVYHEQKKYSKALDKYHLACSLALINDDMNWYAPSVLYSGRLFYELKKWKEAIPHFEYVVSNGRLFDPEDYTEALQKLFICYNKSENYGKTVSLFNKLKEKDFERPVYMTLCFYYGDACTALKKNDEAYKAYERVLGSGEKAPSVADEFWLRLAVDEFKAGNYGKAETYLSHVDAEGLSENTDLKLLKNIYLSKILLENGKPADAEKKLSGLESAVKKSEVQGAADSYYSTLLQCKLQNEKWEDIPGVYGKLKVPSETDKLAVSTYYYKKGQFDKVDSGCGELYASALCKLGRYEAACSEYERLGGASFDYALALFYCGRYDKAIKAADASGAVQKDYLAGLCFINQKSWKKAVERLAAYIKQSSGRQDFNLLALYYKGYAEYNLAEFKNSYSSFVRYCMESEKAPGAPDSPTSPTSPVSPETRPYLLRSYEYAVKSALQSGDFKNASTQAANLVRCSQDGAQKQKALVLSAEIFVDYGNYDAAIQLLAPYTSGRDDFAAQALFMTAQIYARQGKVQQADEVYRRTYEGYPRSSYADEAMYRAGEVYYSNGEYSPAYTRFNNYVYKYASGRFCDAAMFYCGDCALRLGENDRCVMLNKTLLQKWPDSVYAYGANKNLLEAYYRQEEYSQALAVAKVLLGSFAQQAAEDGIGKRAKELEKIVNGTDRRVAEKESEFASLGGAGTVAGRAAGTELVRLYAESLSTQDEAFELASQLLKKQSESSERADAAYNAEFVAEYNRKKGNNKKAAETYLKAAEYYRSVKNDSGAASALYGAAEAFAAEGLKGDARETAALLKELYPQSIQAERVDRVTGDARN